MNCECFYVPNENTIENARLMVKAINSTAKKHNQEVFPVYISKARRNFSATSDYDSCNKPYLVKEGTFLVFVQGKDYCMSRIRPKGGRRGFPNIWKNGDFWNNFYDYIEDIEEVE